MHTKIHLRHSVLKTKARNIKKTREAPRVQSLTLSCATLNWVAVTGHSLSVAVASVCAGTLRHARVGEMWGEGRGGQKGWGRPLVLRSDYEIYCSGGWASRNFNRAKMYLVERSVFEAYYLMYIFLLTDHLQSLLCHSFCVLYLVLLMFFWLVSRRVWRFSNVTNRVRMTRHEGTRLAYRVGVQRQQVCLFVCLFMNVYLPVCAYTLKICVKFDLHLPIWMSSSDAQKS